MRSRCATGIKGANSANMGLSISIAYPLGTFAAWVAAALLHRGVMLVRREQPRSSARDKVQADHV